MDYLSPTYFINQSNTSSSDITIQTEEFTHLVGIMVDFQIEREEFEDLNNNGYWDDNEPFNDNNNNKVIDYYDYNNNGKYDKYLIDNKLYYEDYDNPKTSGLGKFILDSNNLNYNLENFTERCDGFIIDNAPHGTDYFSDQLMAVKNYYYSISDGLIDFNVDMISNIYTVPESMEYYSDSDNKLGELFSKSLILAKDDIESYLSMNNLDVNDVLFAVFHSGLGQDFSVPFLDPTTNDLKSAYIDSDMLDVFNLPMIDNVSINRGLLLPETQNFIFYDVVEDIFPELKNDLGYCGIQVGLTGTFAFLLGYEFKFDSMFLSDGMAGVGKFGLMDYGSNNGRGVIPSPPTPWTRIKIAEKYSSVNDLVQNITESGTYTLKPRHQEDIIYKIAISNSEYYLIENRNNHIAGEFDLEFLQLLYGNDFLCTYCNLGCNGIDIDEIENNADIINECIDNNLTSGRYNYFDLLQSVSTVSSNSVIINNDNYDYGLPGSGLLIWHIDEKRISNNLIDDINCGSINCTVEKRGVELEEADGAVDIGYDSSHPLFDDHINGWAYDFWYPGNEYYFNYGNPNTSNNDTLFFNNSSTPNTKSNEGYLSLISIEILDGDGGDISFNVYFNELYDNIVLSDSTIEILGGGNINGQGNIFYIKDNSIYQHNNSGISELGIAENNKKILVYNNDYHVVDLAQDNLVYWDPNLDQVLTDSDPFIMGYYESSDNQTIIRNSDISILQTSLADIDADGFDEFVFSNEGGALGVKNYNETYVNGFPVEGNFYGTPIIANIIDISDDSPEIICREDDHITILSSEGQRLIELTSFDTSQDIRIIPNWKSDKAVLVDGNRLISFNYDEEYSYWLSKYSNSYDYPVVLNHQELSSESISTIQPSYNYPNPITQGYTTFRFYVENQDKIDINIYDIHGLQIKNFHLSEISNNEYNEMRWDGINNLSPGLYYAEVIFGNDRNSELIKLAIIQ